jgi:hypothetical protein
MLHDDAIRGITRSAAHYDRGLFCPAELWLQVLGRLTVDDAGAVLDGLPRKAQAVLRGAYHKRPGSLRSGSGYDEARRTVEDWCLGG